MASKHVSIPKSFTDGDTQEWFQRFKICAATDEWNNESKLLKLHVVGRRSAGGMVGIVYREHGRLHYSKEEFTIFAGLGRVCCSAHRMLMNLHVMTCEYSINHFWLC